MAGAPHMSPDEFRRLGTAMIDRIAAYMERIGEFPVAPACEPGEVAAKLPASPPRAGEPWDAILSDFDRIILPSLVHWQSPRFFGYFPCNASGPGILGELLSAGLNVNGMLWATSPAATELEARVLDWMADAIGLPASFRNDSGAGGGCIQGTASESALVALVAARRRAMPDSANFAKATVYASTQAHSSIVKAAMIAGMAAGPEDASRVRLIEVDDGLAMRPEALRAAIERDLAQGLTPAMIVATIGTTATLAIDPLAAVVRVRDEAAPGAWVHVDAAHAGSACICPEHRAMIAGVEGADSICFNPHKWLLTNFDCDLFWVRDRGALTAALSITPEYLRNTASDAGSVIDYRDWQIPLGRRFRALKLWFVVRHYGIEALRAHIRGHIRLAGEFAAMVGTDDRFELIGPPTLNLVCLRARAGEAATRAVLKAVNASGKAFISHSTAPGRGFFLRVAIGSPATTIEHVHELWGAMRGALPA